MLDEARELNDSDRPAEAITRAEQALALVRPGGAAPDADGSVGPTGLPAAEIQAQLLRVLSYSHGRLGDIDTALGLLDQALAVDPGQQAGIVGARAVLLLNLGRFAEAVQAFDTAIPAIPDSDVRGRIAALANRGVAHLSTGRLAQAQADTEEAADLAAAAVPSWQGGLRHNLGYLQFLRGDLCGALDSMAEASGLLPPSAQGVPALDRSRVLLAAGLVTEAAEAADAALATFTSNNAVHDIAASLLVLADIALLTADPVAGARLARRSAAISRRRANPANALMAELVTTRARAMVTHQRARRPQRRHALADAGRASELAQRFEAAGLAEQATAARLIAAEAAIDAGDLSVTRTLLQGGSTDTQEPVEPGGPTALTTGLHRRLVAGRVDLAEGRQEAGLDQIAAGLDDLAGFQVRFGSQDLQAAASIHGRNLARLGLRTAVGTQDPALILEWLDRARAVSTRLPALRPPEDPELAADLGSLRVASAAAFEARLAGAPDPTAEGEVVRLRRRVRSRAWTAAGAGRVEGPIGLADARAALAPTADSCLVAIFSGAGDTHAVVLTADTARYWRLGPMEPVLVAARRVAADLDVLAMDRTPPTIRAVARDSLHRQAAELAGMLHLTELIDGTGTSEGTVTVVAAGEIATLPWGLLPPFPGRAVRISPSVTAAARSAAAARAAVPWRPRVLAVHGPDIPRGAEELEGVATSYPTARILRAHEATGDAVVAEIPETDLLHIAAHGVHEPDNPEFSGVLLAGGPLFAYDLAPLARLPRQVVLSSCDVGRSTDRPGGESLGLTAALLRFGVPTVIAGTARVSDAAAAVVMPAYHRELTAGRTPATALARAVASVEEPVPISCFGA